MNGVALEPTAHNLQPASDLFQALANPLRLAIVLHLGRQPHCVHDLVQLVGATQPLVSQHLRVLRGTRLVVAVRQGKEVMYSLQDEHVRHIAEDAVRHIEERDLARL